MGVSKSDNIYIRQVFFKHCICQNEVVPMTFDICPLKHYFFLENIIVLHNYVVDVSAIVLNCIIYKQKYM